jgi:hypothetical protein
LCRDYGLLHTFQKLFGVAVPLGGELELECQNISQHIS